MFGIGSLKYLHTFAEVSFIYKIEQSTLRKKVARGELKIEDEVKKFGNTWVITEKAMIEHFGVNQFAEYLTTGAVSEFQFATGQISYRQKFEEDEDTLFI